MEPFAIAAATLVAKWAAEGFVKEAAKSAWAGFQDIYEAVRAKFVGDPEGTEALERLKAKPTSEARTLELAEVLDARVKADPTFAADLRRLVEEAEHKPGTGSFVTNVMDNAKVGKITNIGTIMGGAHF